MGFSNLRVDKLPWATQAAEGMPRRRFTVAELEALAYRYNSATLPPRPK